MNALVTPIIESIEDRLVLGGVGGGSLKPSMSTSKTLLPGSTDISVFGGFCGWVDEVGCKAKSWFVGHTMGSN